MKKLAIFFFASLTFCGDPPKNKNDDVVVGTWEFSCKRLRINQDRTFLWENNSGNYALDKSAIEFRFSQKTPEYYKYFVNDDELSLISGFYRYDYKRVDPNSPSNCWAPLPPIDPQGPSQKPTDPQNPGQKPQNKCEPCCCTPCQPCPTVVPSPNPPPPPPPVPTPTPCSPDQKGPGQKGPTQTGPTQGPQWP